MGVHRFAIGLIYLRIGRQVIIGLRRLTRLGSGRDLSCSAHLQLAVRIIGSRLVHSVIVALARTIIIASVCPASPRMAFATPSSYQSPSSSNSSRGM